MSTDIRPEISKYNPYYISKHRYYELKHFCLQYPEWQKELLYLNPKISPIGKSEKRSYSDPTSKLAIKRSYYQTKIRLIERIAHNTDPSIENYILKAVTLGYSYTYLSTVLNIPCSKDYYYDRYRLFFWLLSKEH